MPGKSDPHRSVTQKLFFFKRLFCTSAYPPIRRNRESPRQIAANWARGAQKGDETPLRSHDAAATAITARKFTKVLQYRNKKRAREGPLFDCSA